MITNWLLFWKQLPVLWQKLKLLQRWAWWKKLFPFEVDFYHEGLFGEYLSILWFVNDSFFYLLMAIFCLLGCFATFHKLLERSIAVRRACFISFSSFSLSVFYHMQPPTTRSNWPKNENQDDWLPIWYKFHTQMHSIWCVPPPRWKGHADFRR